MEILIVGPGSLGQVYAAAFATAGAQVLLLGRPARLQRLYQDGIHLQGALTGQWEVSSWVAESAGSRQTIVASDRLPDGFHPDLTLFTTKGHQLDAAAAALQEAPLRWIVGLQNGISKDDRLAGFFGTQRVVGGATTIAAERTAGGEVLVAVTGTTWLGPRSA